MDVRSPEEFKSGHFEGAINIPLESIRGKTEFLRRQGKPIILVCRSGARSSMAAGMLKNAGLEVYNGGGWTGFSARIKKKRDAA